MITDNITNLISIIENKQFDNTFYKQFILEEMTSPQPAKMSGMMKGGLAIGGGLLATHLLQSNPELKRQLADTAKSVGSGVKDAATSVGSTIKSTASSVADKIHSQGKEVIQAAKDKAEEYKVTRPVLNDSINEKDLNDNLTKAEAGASNPSLTPAQQKEYARAHLSMLEFQKKQEAAGLFKSGYSKTHNPHAWDGIRSDSEKIKITKDFEGTTKAVEQEVGQFIDKGKEIGSNVQTGVKTVGNALTNIANKFTGKQS